MIDLVDQLYTLAGITAPPPPLGSLAPDGAAAVIGAQGGLVMTSTRHAGVGVPPGVFANPTLVAIERLPNPAQNGQGPLPTSLQQFPQFYDITSSSAPSGQVEVGLCVLDQPHPLAPPANVVSQLRLAHPDPQNPQQVQTLPLAPASFLDCSTATSSLPSSNAFGSLAMTTIDQLGRWTSPAGRFIGVGTLSADGNTSSALSPGGLGGLATSFSPFGAVLPPSGTPTHDIAFHLLTQGGTSDQIWTVDADGSDPRDLSMSPTTIDAGVAWSPDGTQMAFLRQPLPATSTFELWAMNLDGSGQTQLVGSGLTTPPSWSPDGTTIAFALGTGISAVQSNGSGLTPLTQPPPGTTDSRPGWSPDGSRVVFARRTSQGEQLWSMDANGSNQVQITNLSSNFSPGFGFGFSPDGTRVVSDFVGVQGAGLIIVNTDGSGGSVLTTGATINRPDWSPDGTKIAFSGQGVETIDPDGTGRISITPGRFPQWSPDGSQLAYCTGPDPGDVTVSDANGGNVQVLIGGADCPTGIRWRPNGQGPPPPPPPTCGGGSFTGNVVLSSPTDLANLAAAETTQIIGDLTLSGAGISSLSGLPCLTDVTGTISIAASSSLLDIDLPDLQSAGEISVFQAGALQTVNLSGLVSTTAAGLRLNVVGTTQSMSVDLTNLQGVAGPLDVINVNGLTALSLPSLTTIGGGVGISQNAALQTLSLPALTSVTFDMNIDNNTALQSVDFTSLQTASGRLGITNADAVTTLSFPALTSVGTSLGITDNDALTSLALPVLQTAGGFSANNHPVLTSLTAPALTDITAGRIEVTSSPLLPTLAFGSLQNVSGLMFMWNLNALTSLALPSLTNVGEIHLLNNNSLTTITADALVQLGQGGTPAALNGRLEIVAHSALTSLSLASLADLRGSLIILSTGLVDLDALSAVTSPLFSVNVSGNSALTDVSGLGALGDAAGSDPFVTQSFAISNNTSLCTSDAQLLIAGLEAKYQGQFASGGASETGNQMCLGGNLTQLGGDILGEAPGDLFGHSSTISDDGSRIAVGATQNAGGGVNSGSVRAFEWNGSAWVQIGQDIDGAAPNVFSGAEAGIALSGDGTRLAVGSWRFNSGRGRVRVFELMGSTWTLVGQELTFAGAQDQFGRSVSLSTDGNTLAVGAPIKSVSGAAMVYDLVGSTWTQRGSDILGEAGGDRFGGGISISADGNRVAVGAPANSGVSAGAGHVRILDWTGQNWVQVGGDIDGEQGILRFGWFVHLSRDGARVAATAFGSNPGYVKVHELVGNAWVQMGPVFNQANFGYQTVSLSSDGSRFALGDPIAGNTRGSLKVFDWTGASWSQIGMDVVGVGASDQFGRSVAISADGTRVVSGAWVRPTPATNDQRGAASVFTIP